MYINENTQMLFLIYPMTNYLVSFHLIRNAENFPHTEKKGNEPVHFKKVYLKFHCYQLKCYFHGMAQDGNTGRSCHVTFK